MDWLLMQIKLFFHLFFQCFEAICNLGHGVVSKKVSKLSHFMIIIIIIILKNIFCSEVIHI